jgi:hypothetical protein
MFQIDVRSGHISRIPFPTFEEASGLADLAIMRKESFKSFDIAGCKKPRNQGRRSTPFRSLFSAGSFDGASMISRVPGYAEPIGV